MENTPTVFANDLPSILRIFKNDLKVEKCKQFSPAAGFVSRQYKQNVLPAKAPPRRVSAQKSFTSPDSYHFFALQDLQYPASL